MSIKSALGNIVKSVGDTIDSVVNQAQSAISNIVGAATTAIGNLYSGGFVGMNRDGMEALTSAVNDYCKTIEDSINEFNDEADLTDAYAGEVKEAVHSFVEAMKKLLGAYVSTMRKEQEEAATAYNSFHSSEKSIASDVTSDAENVTTNAESIRVESKNISLE